MYVCVCVCVCVCMCDLSVSFVEEGISTHGYISWEV